VLLVIYFQTFKFFVQAYRLNLVFNFVYKSAAESQSVPSMFYQLEIVQKYRKFVDAD